MSVKVAPAQLVILVAGDGGDRQGWMEKWANLQAEGLVEEALRRARARVLAELEEDLVAGLRAEVARIAGGVPDSGDPVVPHADHPLAAVTDQPLAAVTDQPLAAVTDQAAGTFGAERVASLPVEREATGVPPAQARAWYLYGIVESQALSGETWVGDLTGVAGAALEILEEGPLAAVGSEVSADGRWAPISAAGDLSGIEDEIRAHEQVVEALQERCGGALPARFATALTDREAMRRRLCEERKPLLDRLRLVQGTTEWTLALAAPPALARNRAGQAAALSEASETSGRSYLTTRSEQQRWRLQGAKDRNSWVGRLDDEMGRVVEATVAQDPRPFRELPGLLRRTYLVTRARQDEFLAVAESTVDALADELPGLAAELSGPWPPYHFATVEVGV